MLWTSIRYLSPVTQKPWKFTCNGNWVAMKHTLFRRYKVWQTYVHSRLNVAYFSNVNMILLLEHTSTHIQIWNFLVKMWRKSQIKFAHTHTQCKCYEPRLCLNSSTTLNSLYVFRYISVYMLFLFTTLFSDPRLFLSYISRPFYKRHFFSFFRSQLVLNSSIELTTIYYILLIFCVTFFLSLHLLLSSLCWTIWFCCMINYLNSLFFTIQNSTSCAIFIIVTYSTSLPFLLRSRFYVQLFVIWCVCCCL